MNEDRKMRFSWPAAVIGAFVVLLIFLLTSPRGRPSGPQPPLPRNRWAVADAPRKPDAPKLKAEPADAPPDFSGIYSCVGKEKEPYSGSVTLMQLAPGVYKVSWSLTTGDFQGAGLYHGGVLAVSWTFPSREGGRMTGVHILVPHGKDGLSGTWTSLPGSGHPFPETWSKLAAVPKGVES